MNHETFTVTKMTHQDVEAMLRLRAQSWLDTYVNDSFGITREWVQTRVDQQMLPEKIAARKMFLESSKVAGFIARDSRGDVVGVANPYEDEAGIQHVGLLYVDKAWHGKGVGGRLMQEIIDWSDPTRPIELGVVTYNERARSFYRKWGFEEIPGSETLFDNTLPEIMMTRKGDMQ